MCARVYVCMCVRERERERWGERECVCVCVCECVCVRDFVVLKNVGCNCEYCESITEYIAM